MFRSHGTFKEVGQSLKVGNWSMAIPEESYQPHIKELKEDTDEAWGPEGKVKPKIPLIDPLID